MINWLRTHRNKIRYYIIGLVFVSLLIGGWYGVRLYEERKATEAMIAQRNARREAMSTSAAAEEAAANDSGIPDFSEDQVVFQDKGYRRSQYVKAILCMGVDRSDKMNEKRELGEAGQADGVFLIAQDTARNTLKILMIPRDSMTEVTALNPDGSVRGLERDHLLMAYAYGDGQEESCKNMRESTSRLLSGLPIDYYLAVDTSVIGTLNDMVGGVTVTIPTSGMEKADPSFVLGAQVTLKGQQAERFVRYRDIERDNSALFRMDQHQEYIMQFFQAVKRKSAEDSQIVPRLFESIQDYMVTDMAKDQYLKIAVDALNAGGFEKEDFYTLPGSGVTTEVYDEYYADPQGVAKVVLNLFYREED